ncbi:MAG: rhomboid family protein [Bryobacteraceae bacterium]|jgi:hypothetical protein
MTGLLIHQRCWNHELREAVCRCPSCGRHFCRECVTEHESRLLCAACLLALARAAPARSHRARALLTPVAALGSFFLAWMIFYIGGEILMEITARVEQTWLLR